jgi:phage terminase large subunit-like protein
MAVLCTYLSTLVDWSENLTLGERGLALFLAPSERQATNVFRYAAAVIDHSPTLAALVTGRTQDTLTLSTGCDLEVQPASWRRSRSGTAIGIVLDECAFFYSARRTATRKS